MKAGLVNGDLHTNAPFGMTADDIRPSVQFFFSNVDSYGVKHAQQIDAFKFMPQSELGWVAITHSESRLIATLDYADQTGRNLIRGGDPELGRQSLSQAITSAHAGGRLTLSEHGIARFENTFGAEAARPLRIPPGQSGFISPQLLTGDLSIGHTLRAAGIVASAVDALNTAQQVKTLLQQDNLLGAKHELRDYAANNTNAWLAAYSFGKLGAELSVARGGRHVGAAAGAIAGGIIGYTMSDQAMETVDAKQIRSQIDARNMAWYQNGTEWVRDIPADLRDDGVDAVREQTFAADPATSRYLDFKASNTAVEIALSRVPKPMDPYSIDAPAHDSPHAPTVRWTRHPDNGHWEHRAPPVFAERGLSIVGNTPVPAPPALAARLDAQSNAIISANIANGPAPIAARYNVAHHLNGWDTVQGVQRSPAVDAALDPDRLRASNGEQYRLGQDGQWRSDDAVATGNIAHELTATRAALQPRLQQHGQTMAALPAWQEPTPEQRDLTTLANQYRGHGVQPNLETLAAAQLAISVTREQHGLGQHNSSLALDPNVPEGRHTVQSSIAHLATGQDGAVRPVAWTTGADIEWARSQLQKQPTQATTQTAAAATATATATAQPADQATEQAQRSLQAQLEQLRLHQARMDQEAQAEQARREQQEREQGRDEQQAALPEPQAERASQTDRLPDSSQQEPASDPQAQKQPAGTPFGSTGDPDLDRLAAALYADDDAAISQAAAQIARSETVQAFERWGHDLLSWHEQQERQQALDRQAQERQQQEGYAR